MNKLENYTSLKQEVQVYIPSTQKNGQPVDNRTTVIEDTQRLLSTLFGGFTSTTAKGGWTLETGSVQSEQVEIVSSSATDLDDASINLVVDYALELCQSLNQEAISLKVNGQLHFIS